MEAQFVDEEGQSIHDGLGGSSVLNADQTRFTHVVPYRNLDTSLRAYVPENLGLSVPQDSWDSIYDQLIKRETDLKMTKSDNKVKDIFSKVWFGLGKHYEAVEPWLDLIPSEYGLSVLKSAVVLVFLYAVKSNDERQKLYDAFAEIRNTIAEARFYRESFQSDSEVSKTATELYTAIVEAIEELCQHLPSKEPSDSKGKNRLISKFRKKDKPPNPDIVLKKVKEKAKELKLCTRRRANRTIEDTYTIVQQAEMEIRALGWGMSKLAVMGRDVSQGIASVDENVVTVRASIGQMNKSLGDIGSTVDGVDKTTRRVETKMDDVDNNLVLLRTEMKESRDELKRFLERTLMNDSLTAKNRLVELLEERRRNKAIILEQSGEIQRLKQKLQDQRGSSVQTRAPSMNLLSVHELLAVVAHAAADSVSATDVDSLLLQPSDDLLFIAARRDDFDARSIGQANSILRNSRFLDWMQTFDSDFILVDGNIPSTAGPNVSALSPFCSTFVANLARLYPQDIVVSFFCGCHISLTDPWYGPVGLVRSLLTQVLMALIERGETTVKLEIAEDYLEQLGSANLEILCVIFEKVITGLPQGVSVTCVIDNVSSYDRDFRGLFEGLKTVIYSLGAAASGGDGAACKILLTNSGRSTGRLSNLVEPSQYVLLTPDMLGPRTISDRSMEANLSRSRPVTPEERGVPITIDEWD